jgi:hypothetical protein
MSGNSRIGAVRTRGRGDWHGLWNGLRLNATSLTLAATMLLIIPAFARAQGAGTALEFDGAGDYVSVANHSSLNLTGDFSIELFLEPGATFDASATDYQGILDKSDYQMYLDPDDGKLKFVQPMAGAFSGEFNSNLDGDVWALAAYNGDLYVGGEFTTAGGMPAQNIARWDGTAWSTVGTGLDNGTVLALLVYEGELYAGGDFENAGGVEVNGIAKWDGNSWSAVGPGFFGGPVRALAEYNTDLYAGGEFIDNGIITLNRIARWDGLEWSAVADGFDNAVYALHEYDGELCAGGSFTTTGAVPVQGMGRWNGSSWSDVGGGVAGGFEETAVHALAVYDGDLIVGGDFDTAGGMSAPLMARWNGSIWSAMGTEEAGMSGVVRTLAVFDGKLCAAGNLFWQGMVRHVAMWNGFAWSSAGTHVSGDVYTLAVYGSDLYAGGEFSSVAGTPGEHLAAFDGGLWHSVGATPSGPPGWVYVGAMAVHQDELYVGGEFQRIGANSPMQNIAKWDGSAWDSLANGADDTIDALTVYNSQLYAAGSFGSIGSAVAERIAMWNGSNWSALGDGCDSQVWALAEFDGQLYVGGQFTTAGGQPAEHIARWDGDSWSTVGNGTNQAVRAFAVYNEELYVGGWFTEAGGLPATHIAKWDGGSWSTVGGGVDDDVLALAVYNNKLYAGGRFTTAGGEGASCIAQWDGVGWSPVGAGMSGPVRTLTVYNNELYAGGDFYVAGLQVAPHIARWNGNTWSAVDVGTDQPVNALAVWDDPQVGGLFVGGSFHRAGDFTSPYFARWGQPLRSIASSRTSWPAVQHHVAVTHDQADLRLYVNGLLETTESTVEGEVDTTTTPLWIGRSSGPPIDGGSGEFFGGQLDEIRVWNEWRSEVQVRDSLNHKLGGGESGLTAYYRFDEGDGGVTVDSSPNNNAGSLVGPSWVTSTAPLGDASVWTDDGSPLSLSSGYGDWLELVDLTGAPPFAALIRVDEAPNSTEVGSGLFQVFSSHYFEAWIPEGSAPTYTAVHHYAGHPGVTDENVLALAFRPDAEVSVWEDSMALLDTGDDTLRVEGETGGQYILGEAGYDLTLAVSPPGAGMTSPPSGTYLVGDIVDLRATPNAGYVFDHWTTSAGAAPVVDPGCPTDATVLMDADKTVTAVFTTGQLIDSLWVGGTECAGAPGDECWDIAENWCPQITPNNVTDQSFDVTVSGATVTLDMSPTIDALSLLAGTTVVVSDSSGADIRSLAVVGDIANQGVFRATDRERLVLDAPVIDQGGVFCTGGVLEATDGVEGIGEENDKSILEINGSLVLGGTVRTIGDHSEVHLIGGAELVDVCVQGVVVPDGQIGSFSGTIENAGTLRVAPDGLEDTLLAPGLAGGILSGDGGDDDRVRLGGESVALLGDFDSSFANASNHVIDGAGIIFGEVTNDGIIEANSAAGEHLIISPPGEKTNNGSFRATSGGTLEVAGSVGGTGAYAADNGMIKLTPDGGFASISGSTFDIANGGVVDVDQAVSVALTGAMTVNADGTYRADPDAVDPVSATLEAGSITIMESTLGGAPGSMILTDSMSVTSTGDFILDGTNAGSCEPGRSDTPPILRVWGVSRVSVSTDLQLLHSADLLMGASAQMEVSGSFVNHSVYPECFDCLEGTLLLSGTGPQTLEIAGEDRGADPSGFVENFAMGTVELEAGVTVSIIDVFDNQEDGSTGCDEVLYVDTLILNAGAVLSTGGCTVYYNNLQNSGGSIPGLGSEVLNIAGADVDDDGDVDLDDYTGFADCFVGPGGNPDPPPPLTGQKCLDRFDVDHDFDLDLLDYGNFQNRFDAGG